jgi:hypothetical protein
MIVRLRRKNTRYPDLIPDQPYVVIGIEAGELRILNDAGRPHLYSPKLFLILDTHEPGDGVTEFGEDGERYAYPAILSKPGFFEDFQGRALSLRVGQGRLQPEGGKPA